jgi:uncharacterized protein (DUF4415 family)
MTAAAAAALVARGEDGTDWAAYRAMTDEEIDRQIAADPDAAPEADAAWFAAAARAAGSRKAAKRQAIAFKVDPDVLAFFKREGPGYQTRMHAVLRAYVDHQRGRAR